MNRKPIFDAIRYERDLPIRTDDIPIVDGLLTSLGFPINPTSASVFTPPLPSVRGRFNRETIFDEIRRQRGYIAYQEVTSIDEALTRLGFPPITAQAVIKSGSTASLPPVAPTTKPALPTAVKAGSLAAVIGVAAVTLLNPLLNTWEGNKTTAYRDHIGIPTNCRGNTKNVKLGTTLSVAQCDIINEAAAIEHASPVLKTNPELANAPYQLVPAISLAYNIGTSGWAKSSARRLFNQNRWLSACKSMLAYNKAGGKFSRGLQNRRNAEYKICISHIPAGKAV